MNDSMRFPDRNAINEMLVFNRALAQPHSHSTICSYSPPPTAGEGILKRSKLYQVWDAVRDAKCEFYYITVCRHALKKVRSLVGTEAYYAEIYHLPFRSGDSRKSNGTSIFRSPACSMAAKCKGRATSPPWGYAMNLVSQGDKDETLAARWVRDRHNPKSPTEERMPRIKHLDLVGHLGRHSGLAQTCSIICETTGRFAQLRSGFVAQPPRRIGLEKLNVNCANHSSRDDGTRKNSSSVFLLKTPVSSPFLNHFTCCCEVP